MLMPETKRGSSTATQRSMSSRSSAGVGRSSFSALRMQPPRCPVDDEIDGYPSHDDEVPVVGIFGGVHEALAFDHRGEEEDRKDDGVDGVGEQMDDVKADKGPDGGAVGVDAPVGIEVQQFEVADDNDGDADQRHDDEPDLHGAGVANAGTAAVPLIWNRAEDKDDGVERAPKEVRRVGVRGPFNGARVEIEIGG